MVEPKDKSFLVWDNEGREHSVRAKTRREAVVKVFADGGFKNPHVVLFWNVQEVGE